MPGMKPPWMKKNPRKFTKAMTPEQKKKAKAAAAKGKRPYPNLVDNMRASQGS